jgi:hypothetical protein
VLDVDANELLEGFDGVLALRWLFGLRGDPMIEDALGDLCDRCTAEEIVDYLESIAAQLDADDNARLEPLTDGVLLLRWLLGLRDQALVSGAVAPDCNRCTAGEIDDYLGGL